MKRTVTEIKSWGDVGQIMSLFSQYAVSETTEPSGQCTVTINGKRTVSMSLELTLKIRGK